MLSWAIKEEIGGALRTRSHRRFSAALMAARSLGLASGVGSAGWLPGRLLFSVLSAAALAQPTDEPSDHERGQQERDDHADAGEHIGENNSGAALDGHGDPHEICTNTSVGSVEGIAFEALSV